MNRYFFRLRRGIHDWHGGPGLIVLGLGRCLFVKVQSSSLLVQLKTNFFLAEDAV